MDENPMAGGDPFSLAPESVTPGQLYVAIQSLSIRQTQQNNELIAMRKEISEQREATQHLVAAWKTGGFLLSAIKTLGFVGTAILSIYGAYNISTRIMGP